MKFNSSFRPESRWYKATISFENGDCSRPVIIGTFPSEKKNCKMGWCRSGSEGPSPGAARNGHRLVLGKISRTSMLFNNKSLPVLMGTNDYDSFVGWCSRYAHNLKFKFTSRWQSYKGRVSNNWVLGPGMSELRNTDAITYSWSCFIWCNLLRIKSSIRLSLYNMGYQPHLYVIIATFGSVFLSMATVNKIARWTDTTYEHHCDSLA